MAKIYVLKDNSMVLAESFTELVTRLREQSIVPPLNNIDYMKEVQRRCKIYYGENINISSEETFVKNLLKLHEIKFEYEVNENE